MDESHRPSADPASPPVPPTPVVTAAPALPNHGDMRPEDAAAVAGVAVGGAITVAIGEGQWDLWAIPLGLMLLLILTGFVPMQRVAQWPRKTQQFAYAMMVGLCLMIMVAWVVEIYLRQVATFRPGHCLIGSISVPLECVDPLDQGERLWDRMNHPETPARWSMPLNSLTPLIIWIVASLAVFSQLRSRQA